MIEVRPGATRGHADHGWLKSQHTFSFADYRDPRYDGFGPLRVINEDRVVPGMGFGTHGHRDMEIISYVVSGTLAHKDSMGTVAELHPGDVQVMSAGTGVMHSEFNGSTQEPVHFLQIWIVPDRRGEAPRYKDANYPPATRTGRLCPIASMDGRDGSLPIHQDAVVYASILPDGRELETALAAGRSAYVQVVRGALAINGSTLAAGDGAAIVGERALQFRATGEAEFLFFDLP